MAIAGRTGGQILISMFGKNLTTKEVDIYQNLITTGEPVSFSTDPLSSGNYDWVTVRDRAGNIIGQVQGDEVDPEGELSLSVLEDFVYLNNDYVYGNSKNRLINMFNGEAFKNGADVIVPIGTNGTDKTVTTLARAREMNLPYKHLLHIEGSYIKNSGTADPITGKVSFRKNPFESSFNMTHKTVCIEFRTTTGDGQVTKMFPIVAKSSAEWAEGDTNQFNLTGQRGCDIWERDDFWTEVYKEEAPKAIYRKNDESLVIKDELASDSQVFALPVTLDSSEIFVDYIINAGATEPTGKAGELACIIGVDGTVSIKKFDTAWVNESELTNGIKVGVRIKSKQLVFATDVIEDVNCFVGIQPDGKAIRFSTEGAVKKYFARVMDLNKDTAMFVPYVTAE
ncbi:MAG: hypothetical protein ACRCZ0_10855 [Cetobacterium sp.]